MARKIIDIGTVGNDGTGDSIRDSFRKVNDNFRELYSSLGLGERLTFIGLSDGPGTYDGQLIADDRTKNTPIVTINNTGSGVMFKRLVEGNGISIDFINNPNEITINADFAEISADRSPQLGGDLSMRSGGEQFRIIDAGTDITPLDPIYKHELVNKNYADTKVSKAGTLSINPETGQIDPSMGRMSGPLILSRDPEPDDDINYDGLIAASKRYVDNSAFGSSVNLYVALSGQDDRVGVSKNLQGRALAYAYRTLEAALKRAEELVNEANVQLGPYKKTLTYNNHAAECTLTEIATSPTSGTGFVGVVKMSVDSVTLNSVGTNYYPGDILEIQGGTTSGGAAYIQVLTTQTYPGAIVTYKVLSTGSYTALPGSTNIATVITTAGGPEEVGGIGVDATFDLTYKVNSVEILDGGEGYSLVSVRITGGGGEGAFGTALVESGAITSITINNKGSGFTSLPLLSVDLPRFLIYTNGYRTDYTGDVTTDTPEAARGRDIREGLFLRGETSGALAEILSHQGALDSDGNEIFDVDIKLGAFIPGEVISYGDIAKDIQITILVESGEYYENYPLKVPTNVSIVGDEFRRVIIKPRPGTSSSPWAFQRFRRDTVIDGLTVANQNYGFHYLQDTSSPVYPQIENKGEYRSAATLLELNRGFFQEEIISWMNYNIENEVSPFTSSFSYNNSLCKRDVGLLIDSFAFDLKYGRYNRTISAGLKYYQSDSSRIAITTQLNQYLEVLVKLEELMLDVISNTEVVTTYQSVYPQVIDPAYSAESGSDTVLSTLVNVLNDVIGGSASVNYPKDNDQMDVFLANDAVRWQAISAMGHGGFMCVLDPEGQILSRSPYAQECASFSKSQNQQVFAGGMFADGFAGNLEFVINNVVSPTRLEVSGLDRFPQVPASFVVGGDVYRVNYIRDFVYGIGNFTYNTSKCSRDIGIIVNAILDDYILGTNYKHVIAGISYLRSYTSVVTSRQKAQTIAGLNYARDRIIALITSDAAFETYITDAFADVTAIIDAVNVSAAPALTWTAPIGVTSGIENGFQELLDNRTFLMDEITAFINDTQDPESIDTYVEATCRRDVGYFIDAIAYDMYYGGNTATVTAASAYFNGLSEQILDSGEITPSINSFTRLKEVIYWVVKGDTGWTKSTSNTSTQSTTAGIGDATARTIAEDLVQVVINVLTSGLSALPATVDPTFSAGTNYSSHDSTKTFVLDNLTNVQSETIAFINSSYDSGSRATFVLDETTPWPYTVFNYNSAACERDVGLIVDGLGYDLVFGTNYWTRINGLSYRMSQSSEVIQNQRSITLRAIDYAHELVNEEISSYPVIQSAVTLNNATLDDIIDRGTSAVPSLTFTLPTGLSTDLTNAYTLALANRDYIVAEVDGWIKYQISHDISPWALGDTYNVAKSQRDTRLVVEAAIHDMIYGGNAATRQAGLKYYNNLTGASMLATGQDTRCSAAISYAGYVVGQVVQNLAPATSYSTLTRVTGTGATATEQSIIETLILDVASAISTNDYDAVVAAWPLDAPDLDAYAYNSDSKAARQLIQDSRTLIQTSVIDFVNRYGNRYELIMPGNRSMLANDFTQINDMGYGAVAHNGGLLELVSVFTYYCWISYYSINGGQIRSVSGSSSHGWYALVAEGADPLEVPTPTTIYDDLAQRVDCYYPSPIYANVIDGLIIYVTNYNTVPLGGSELEINHNGEIYRYPVTSVATSDDLPSGVARLNLGTGTGVDAAGLFASVPDGTKMSLRQNSKIRLTGDLVNVAVRPSTGLKLRETDENVYRVLQFTATTDANGPYELLVTAGNPGVFSVLVTVTDIASNVCTTASNHKLQIGDTFVPTSSSNGLVEGTTYFIIDVPNYNEFTVSVAPGGTEESLTDGTGLTIKGVVPHRLIENYTISFTTTDTLPDPLSNVVTYYVLATDLTDTEFTISYQKNGTAIELLDTGVGNHYYAMQGLTVTQLKENYNYLDLVIWAPGEFTTDYPTGRVCTFTAGSPVIVNLASHDFSIGDVIRLDVSEGGTLPSGLSSQARYFIITDGFDPDFFQISLTPEGSPAETFGSGSGTFYVGTVTGNVGDDNFAVVGVGTNDIPRVPNSKFVFLGEEYIITNYQTESTTGKPYCKVILNRPLEDAINAFSSSYTIRSAVATRSSGSLGTLTIRISLTRVTSHDLLEIGTGSYADTNYPKEIYGPSVNPINADYETEERDVGRCFYVTTDQYGNFSVGPFFHVDQGTGQVTFSSSIALTNLDGIGFKRGVPIAEFSTDSAFTDNATDTVPTENATRIYIERRLGVTHDGATVDDAQLIPTVIGGFMALSGQLAMKGDINMDEHKVINVTDPTFPQDAVNLRSLTFNNFQETTITSASDGALLAFTGSGNQAVNVNITGDIGISRSGNTLTVGISPNVIVNADVNSSAAIDQSKLNMNAATTRANATGIAQADRGLASFSSSDFDVTDGWVSLKGNSVALTDIAQIATKTVLGNASLVTGDVSAVAFSTVVDSGLGIKKTQYSSVGFLKRTSGSSYTSDADYTIIASSSGSSVSVGAGELIARDSSGDFGGRTIDISSVKVDTQLAIDSAVTATGGYIRYYGYNTQGGVLIQDGSLAADKKTAYWNDLHQFKTQNGVSDAPVTCSSVQTLALTTGLSTTAGTITGNWSLSSGSRMQATYSADLAEWYTSDGKYEAGTVLVFGGDEETTTTNVKGDTRVAGVVSTDPAYVMNGQLETKENSVCIALQGRVPCKVVGKIKKGDILITSTIRGVAVAATGDIKVGTVVGKALADYDSDHIGIIEIAVGRT